MAFFSNPKRKEYVLNPRGKALYESKLIRTSNAIVQQISQTQPTMASEYSGLISIQNQRIRHLAALNLFCLFVLVCDFLVSISF